MQRNPQETPRKAVQVSAGSSGIPKRAAAQALGKVVGLSIEDVKQVRAHHAANASSNIPAKAPSILPVLPVKDQPVRRHSGKWAALVVIPFVLAGAVAGIWQLNLPKSPLADVTTPVGLAADGDAESSAVDGSLKAKLIADDVAPMHSGVAIGDEVKPVAESAESSVK